MQLTDFLFLFGFLPLALVLALLAKGRPALRRGAMALLSLLFCASFGLTGLALASVEAGIVFFLARGMDGAPEKKRRALLLLGVVFSAGLLCYYKYTNFFFGILSLPAQKLLPAPVGVSFLTFLLISYLTDVYRGKAAAKARFLDFWLYVFFFPKLTQGPLCRFEDFSSQLQSARRIEPDEMMQGLSRLILGLGKKTLLAGAAGAVSQEVFSLSPDALCPALAWAGAACYAMQIYFDFAGYTDMALGLAGLFGMRLPENFNSPYLAVSITDFWRRWHMSLSGWFRDYVYIPLGGSRCKKARQLRNLLAVWLLTGLWHGANWTFLCWGLWFFFLLAMEKLWLGRLLERLPRALGRLYALACVCIGWVFFNSPTLSYAAGFLRAMLVRGAHAPDAGAWLYFCARQYGLQLLLCVLFSTNAGKKLWACLGRTAAGEWLRLLFLAAVLGLSVLSLSASGMQAFIYAQF